MQACSSCLIHSSRNDHTLIFLNINWVIQNRFCSQSPLQWQTMFPCALQILTYITGLSYATVLYTSVINTVFEIGRIMRSYHTSRSRAWRLHNA